MRIEEIRHRRAAIDGAPWKYEQRGQEVLGFSPGGCSKTESWYRVADIRGWGHLQYMGVTRGDDKAAAMQDANGQFIAHAPEDVEFLLTEVDRLRKALRSVAVMSHYRMAPGGGSVPSGFSCEICEAECGHDESLIHVGDCPLICLNSETV